MKTCMFVKNIFIIKIKKTSLLVRVLYPKYCFLQWKIWIRVYKKRNTLHSTIFYKQGQSKAVLNNHVNGFWMRGQEGMAFSLEEALLWIMGIFYQKPQFKVKRHNNGFVSNKHATFTFQDVFTFPRCPMTAPIHCRGSIGEQVEKQTHLHLRWPEGECISANVWVICSFNAIECIFTVMYIF